MQHKLSKSRWHQGWLTALIFAIVILGASTSRAALAVGPTYTVANDSQGQPTIFVAGAGSNVTLEMIRVGLGNQGNLIENQGNGTWLLKANLQIERDVQLNMSVANGVQVLHLRSQASNGGTPGQIDYASFVYLKANNGIIAITDTKVFSWDPQANTFDTDVTNGRSYLLAKYAARLDLTNAELGYLGSADGESYGVSWRDIGEINNQLLTRVTGNVIGSTFHHNYYGIYTFQASNMQFKNNIFRDNINYGFDPHDYSHDFLIEDNQAYGNGSHGFIISRGCYNFTFRRNVSHTNNNPDPIKLAHGFMLDPGSPESQDPQAPSTNNTFEQNQAYDNEGYGLRILGSTNNIVRGNRFEHNLQGIVVELGSTSNTIDQNVLVNNQINGLFVRGGADNTIVTGNTLSGNGVNGIYVKSSGNKVHSNTSTGNTGAGIILLPEKGTMAALADLSLPGRLLSSIQVDPELVGNVQISVALGNNSIIGNRSADNGDDGLTIKGAIATIVTGNTIEHNHSHGVYLDDGAQQSRLVGNVIHLNMANGIRANGTDTIGNIWSENSISGNGTGGIQVTSGAQGGIRPPAIDLVTSNQVGGSSIPGSVVEIFSDTFSQGLIFEGRTTTGADGRFSFTTPTGWHAARVNATTTTELGSSAFTYTSLEPRTIWLPLIVR